MHVGAQIIAEATLLASAIKTSPHSRVRRYPEWDLAQLGRHVGEVHGWATSLVRDRATQRPVRAKLDGVASDDVPGVLHIGAVALAEVLDGCDPQDPVWTFGSNSTNAFWRRRMINETTIHRWDAQDAIGAVSPISEEAALDGLDECLDIYCSPTMEGWSLSCDGARIAISLGDASCRISGDALGLWLLAMGRRGSGQHALKGFDVSGDAELALRFADLCAGARGPA